MVRDDIDELGLTSLLSADQLVVALSALIVLVGVATLGIHGVAAIVLLPLGFVGVHRVADRRRARRHRRGLIDACRVLSRGLAAGRPVSSTLASMATESRWAQLGVVDPLRAATDVGIGFDVDATIRRWGSTTTDPHERRIALALSIANEHGADVTAGLDRIAEDIRTEHELDDRRRALTAQTRMQAGALVSLPLLFGLLATGLAGGGIPDRPIALVAIAAGVALDVAGLAWMRRLARGVEVDRDPIRSSLAESLMLIRLGAQTGATIRDAVGLAAEHGDGAVAVHLRHASARIGAGFDLRSALEPAASNALLEQLADVLVRAERDGDHVDLHLEWLARDLRASREAALELAAQRAAMVSLAPLVLCILPAFVLIAFVPLLVSSLDQLRI